jgi:NADP-dependent 3-hydroxy acid dehydrogenase YdfG
MTKSVAIVTGASSGIGKATALRLARDFAAVVLVARSGEKLSEIAEQIGGSCESLVLELDLMSPAAADQVVKATLERFGRIKALINVAGAVPGLDLFLMTDEQWDASMQLKFHGARRLTIAAWEALKASKGAVVFTSGNAAVIPKAGAAAVGSINAAIEALATGGDYDGTTPGYAGKGGGLQQDHTRRGQAEISPASGYQPVRRARGDCGSHRLCRLAAGALDDRHGAPDGWR